MILVPNVKYFDDYKESTGFKLRRLSIPEAEELRRSVETASKNSPIGEKYIKDLIEQVAINTKSKVISTNMPKLFDIVYESRKSENPIDGGM